VSNIQQLVVISVTHECDKNQINIKKSSNWHNQSFTIKNPNKEIIGAIIVLVVLKKGIFVNNCKIIWNY